MDVSLFVRMLSDKSIVDLKTLGCKYPHADLKEFVTLLDSGFYKPLPLKDFNGRTWSIWILLPRFSCRRPRCC